jgi:hypothetical protein
MVMQVEKKKQRDYSILTTLDLLGMATRSQLQAIHQLGSNRNATRILKNLEKYTSHFRVIENIYYLNKEGRELIGSTKVVTKTLQYEHTIMRNDIYVHFQCPKNWMNEYVIPAKEFRIVADSVFQAEKEVYFLEVDNMQKMKQNYEKIDKYKRFKEMGLWQQQNAGHFPTLLFYTTKDNRQNQLREYCKQKELKALVYTKEDLN